jgi:hypothetical protein
MRVTFTNKLSEVNRSGLAQSSYLLHGNTTIDHATTIDDGVHRSLPDQAALMGMLSQRYLMILPLVSVERLSV